VTTIQIAFNRMTAEEFAQRVLAIHPKVAVFDCDGTVWNGDAGYGFMIWSLEKGLVSRSTSDWIDTRFRAYQAGAVSEIEICGEMTQMYAGLRESELRQAAAQYVAEFITPSIFDEIKSLIAALQSAGTNIWAVSSTNKWVIAEAVRSLEIPENRILAAEVRVTNGMISSDLVDVPTDAGKAASLRRVGLPAPDAVFGNSIHDLAMLEIARHPFPVNPSPALLKVANRNAWSYFVPMMAASEGTAVGGELPTEPALPTQ